VWFILGDPTGTGRGGSSIYGDKFPDEVGSFVLASY
jgi:hypothetical protein